MLEELTKNASIAGLKNYINKSDYDSKADNEMTFFSVISPNYKKGNFPFVYEY